jgi:hypothetical protein
VEVNVGIIILVQAFPQVAEIEVQPHLTAMLPQDNPRYTVCTMRIEGTTKAANFIAVNAGDVLEERGHCLLLPAGLLL